MLVVLEWMVKLSIILKTTICSHSQCNCVNFVAGWRACIVNFICIYLYIIHIHNYIHVAVYIIWRLKFCKFQFVQRNCWCDYEIRCDRIIEALNYLNILLCQRPYCPHFYCIHLVICNTRIPHGILWHIQFGVIGKYVWQSIGIIYSMINLKLQNVRQNIIRLFTIKLLKKLAIMTTGHVVLTWC